jgi:hypothetical protein
LQKVTNSFIELFNRIFEAILKWLRELITGSKKTMRNYWEELQKIGIVHNFNPAELKLFKELSAVFDKTFKKTLREFAAEGEVLRLWKMLKPMKALAKNDIDDLLSLRQLNKAGFNKYAAKMKAKVIVNGKTIEFGYSALAGDSENGTGLCTNASKDYIAKQLDMKVDKLYKLYQTSESSTQRIVNRFHDSEHKIFSAFDEQILALETKHSAGSANVVELNFKTLYEPCMSCKRQIVVRQKMYNATIRIEAVKKNSKTYVTDNKRLREVLFIL